MTAKRNPKSGAPDIETDLISEAERLHGRLLEALDENPRLVARILIRLASGMPSSFLVDAAESANESLVAIWINDKSLASALEAEIDQAFVARIGRDPTREEREKVAAAMLQESGLSDLWEEAEAEFLRRFSGASFDELAPFVDKIAVRGV